MITQYSTKTADGKPLVLKLNPDGTHPTPVTPEERAAAQAALDRVEMATSSQNWPSPADNAADFLKAFLRP